MSTKIFYGETPIGVIPEGNQDINTLSEYDVEEKATARISETERAKIIPENIKKDISILGVTGTHEGGITPSGNQDISTLDEYDVTNKATARVSAEERAKIIPSNITRNVSILGVAGTAVVPTGFTTINSNGTHNVTEYAGVDVQVTPALQAKSVTPSTSQQVITPDTGKDGLSQVTIGAVTSAIDANIVAGNIKKDVSILGVTGTYEGSITPVKLERPKFYPGSYGSAGCIYIEKNSLNGKFETTHAMYDSNGTFISDIDILGVNGDDDNAFAARVGLTTGNYRITAKNPLPAFEESDKTSSITITVTELSFDLTHLTLSGTIPSKIINWSRSQYEKRISFAINTESSEYVRPNSIIVQLPDLRTYTLPGDGSDVNMSHDSRMAATIAGSYNSSTGQIVFSHLHALPTQITSLKIIAAAEVAQTGHTVTIHLDGSTFWYTICYNTLTVDGTGYYLNGGVGDWDTDFPDNGKQIRANEVSISGEYFRWKDSDTSSWQENVAKTWSISRDNFEIWIETAMDE